MPYNAEYEAKLVKDLNGQVKAKLDHLGEELAYTKLANRQNFKAIRNVRRQITLLYMCISFLLFCIIVLALNVYNSV